MFPLAPVWLIFKGFFGGVLTFVKDNFVPILVAVAVGLVFYGGMRYERIEAQKEIARITKDYQTKEAKRKEAIDERVKKAEDLAKVTADKAAAEVATANAAARTTVEKFKAEETARKQDLENTIAAYRVALTKGSDPKVLAELQAKIESLSKVYGLSPSTVVTINQLILDYSGER